MDRTRRMLMLIGISSLAASGQGGPLSGLVKDSLTGEPVAGALVQLAGGTEKALTDSAGRFSLGASTGIARLPQARNGKVEPGRGAVAAGPGTPGEPAYAADGTRVPPASLLHAGVRGPRFTLRTRPIAPVAAARAPEARGLGKGAAARVLRIEHKRFKIKEAEVSGGDTAAEVRLAQKPGWQLDGTNTGLSGLGIDRSSLPVYSGPGTPAKGTVIRMQKITIPLWLKNGDITIDRCWFQPASSLPGGLIVTYHYDTGASAPSLSTILDSDLDGSLIGVADVAYQCAVRGLATVRRCHISGMGTGIALYGSLKADILIEQNFVHGLRAYGNGATTGSHNEAATIRGYLGNSLIFRNNRLVCRTGNDTGGLFIQAWAEAINHVLITGNQIESGGYGMPLEAHDRGYGNDLRAIDNRFVTVAGGYGPAYVSGGPGWAQWSENHLDDPSQPDHKGRAVAKP